jgi:8-oxo-dGTP diphosphatase
MFREIDYYGKMPRKKGLTFAELRQAYDVTDWRVILLDERIPREYNEVLSLSLFKAFVLPFLIEIPSERALVREIIERERLRVLCGFMPGEKMPEQRSFWHFRHRFFDVFPDLLTKVMISMVLGCKPLKLSLPFVIQISDLEKIPDGQPYLINLNDYQLPIETWSTPIGSSESRKFTVGLKEKIRSVKNFHQWQELLIEFEMSKMPQKRRLFTDLALPVEVKATLDNGEIARFAIDEPIWLKQPSIQRTDTLTTIGSSISRPYFACHVIVIKRDGAHQQILLSKRMGGFGKGMYTLPGGKQKEGETLQACACRELFEETRMILRNSRPISLHVTRYPGKPQVSSVGILSIHYIGEPDTVEKNQHSMWEWFDLQDLPAPLFGPTQIVINHYLVNKYPNLAWSDVESGGVENKRLVEQLSLWK